jgi:hypothetical protein
VTFRGIHGDLILNGISSSVESTILVSDAAGKQTFEKSADGFNKKSHICNISIKVGRMSIIFANTSICGFVALLIWSAWSSGIVSACHR